MLSSLQGYSCINVVMALGYRRKCCLFRGSVRRGKITTLLWRHCALATSKDPRLPMWGTFHTLSNCVRTLTLPGLRPGFGLWWSWSAVICLRCPASSPLRPRLPSRPACAAPGRGVRPCLLRGSASTEAARPSSTTVLLPRQPPLPSAEHFLFSSNSGNKNQIKYPLEIPLDSFLRLRRGFSGSPPHSSSCSWKLSSFGKKEKTDQPSLLVASPSWLRWNLIWIAGFWLWPLLHRYCRKKASILH